MRNDKAEGSDHEALAEHDTGIANVKNCNKLERPGTLVDLEGEVSNQGKTHPRAERAKAEGTKGRQDYFEGAVVMSDNQSDNVLSEFEETQPPPVPPQALGTGIKRQSETAICCTHTGYCNCTRFSVNMISCFNHLSEYALASQQWTAATSATRSTIELSRRFEEEEARRRGLWTPKLLALKATIFDNLIDFVPGSTPGHSDVRRMANDTILQVCTVFERTYSPTECKARLEMIASALRQSHRDRRPAGNLFEAVAEHPDLLTAFEAFGWHC